MDVRCSKCGTEYELDDDRVSTTATPVQCSTCGHVFKVRRDDAGVDVAAGAGARADRSPSGLHRRPSSGGSSRSSSKTSSSANVVRPPSSTSTPVQPASGLEPSGSTTPPSGTPVQPRVDGEWMVRRVDGTSVRFKELTTLQKWIVERKVGRDDEISKTGRNWKRLGEIAELTSFFQVVEAADAAMRATQVAPVAEASSPGLRAPAPVDAGPRHPVVKTPIPARITANIPAPLPPVAPPSASVTATLSSSSSSGASLAAHAPASAAAPAPAAPAPVQADVDALAALDDDDPVLAWQRRRERTWRAAIAMAALLVVGAIALRMLWSDTPTPLDAALLARTAAALHDDDTRALQAAITALEPEASAGAVRVWQARLRTAQAASLVEQARLVDVRHGQEPGAATDDRDALQTRARELLSKAYADVTAARSDPTLLADASLASAAINLVRAPRGDELRADLDVAAQHAGAQRAAVEGESRVLLLLAEAQGAIAGNDAGALRAVLDKLSTVDDGRVRAAAASVAVALVVAPIVVAPAVAPASDIDTARARIALLHDDDARRMLLTAIVEAAARPTPRDDVDAGVADAGDPDAGALASDAGPSTPTTGVASTGSASSPPSTGITGSGAGSDSYDVVMQKAERALVAEQSGQAYEHLKRATSMRPQIARPWLKLGWAAADLGRNNEAARAFQKALDLDASLSEAQFGLAEALRFSGKSAEALVAYKAYLAMDPAGKDAAIARNAIEKLE